MTAPTKLYRATLREVETRVVDVILELTEEQFEKHKDNLKHTWLEDYSSVEEAVIVDIAAWVVDQSSYGKQRWKLMDAEFSGKAAELGMTREQFIEMVARPESLSIYAPNHETVTRLLKGE